MVIPKLAFLFPGQGSQYMGMGRDWVKKYPACQRVFDEADAALGSPLSKLVFDGPEAQLSLTTNAQPALLTVSIAAVEALRTQTDAMPAVCAGHSLGEYTAFVFAGALPFADAVRSVRDRGQFMQEAVPPGTGAMAAVLGLDRNALEKICQDASGPGGHAAPANYNGGNQIVISGNTDTVNKAGELAKERGAKRVIPLSVSAPFHCRLMQPAADRMRAVLDRLEFRKPSVVVYSNVTALPYEGSTDALFAAEAPNRLAQQIVSPVLWEDIVRNMSNQGVTLFVEMGPGTVLSGLVRRIAPEASALSIDSPSGIEKILEALGKLGF